KLSSRGSTPVAGMYQTLSLGLKLSPCSKYWPWTRRDCCSLPLEETAAPYLLRRHYSLVIAFGPEVAFVTPAIPVDHSNMEWYFKNFPNREIGSPLPNVRGLCPCVWKTLVMSIYDFIGIPSLNGAKVREEAHNFGTPLMGRFVDHTTTPALTGTAKNAAKRKASTRPKVSTNVTKKTKVDKKNPRVGSGDGSEHNDDDTLDDGVQSADIGSAADDFEHSDDIGQGANGDTHHHETEHEEDGYIGFDRGDKDLAGGYYMPYPYDEGSSNSPPYTRDEWDGVRTMNLGLLNKDFLKDPKLMSHVGEVSARYDHVVRNVNRLSKRFLKSGEFNRAFGDVISLAMSVGVEQGLRMALHRYVVSRIISEGFQLHVALLKPDQAVPFSKTSSATLSLGVGTRDRGSAPSTETFGHTSTPEHLKRKKPSGSGVSSAV
ncbi:hypothetical protein Tco_1134730, partial [Tanacetum coccineum]